MQNLEGKQIVHTLHGRNGRAQFQLGRGGGLKTCTGDASLLGEGSGGFFLKCGGSEMVFSTFSMTYFSEKTQLG